MNSFTNQIVCIMSSRHVCAKMHANPETVKHRRRHARRHFVSCVGVHQTVNFHCEHHFFLETFDFRHILINQRNIFPVEDTECRIVAMRVAINSISGP